MAERVLVGAGVGNGVGVGRVFVVADRSKRELSSAIGSRHNLTAIREAVESVADQVEQASGREEVDAVMGALGMMLRDPSLVEQIKSRLADGVTADRAIRGAFAQFARSLTSLGGYFAERSDDLVALAEKVIDTLAGVSEVVLPNSPYVLVTDNLSPMTASKLDPALVLAVITRGGTATSHTGIVLRSVKIPSVVGVSAIGLLTDGVEVLVDASSGQIFLEPSPEELESYARAEEFEDELLEPIQPGELPVSVLANLGSSAEADAAHRVGAQGVGLFRTELLFLGRQDPPTLEEQVLEYTRLLSQFEGQRVVVRVLDTDTDKPLPFLFSAGSGKYSNRGFQVLLANHSILDTQLEALSIAQNNVPNSNLWVMAPMVITSAEANEFARSAKRHGIRNIGIMIEVPEIVDELDDALNQIDFLSIGTNDLSQYTLGKNRHGVGSDISDARDPKVIDVIGRVMKAAKARNIPVGVCGEAAADPESAMLFVQLGVDSLSASPALIPALRETLRR
ncbi:MAG: PEP-utilizing enzyme [Rhodoluna sp.]|nr:PEP-utilizing enzyme [Rhodoluna sp.]